MANGNQNANPTQTPYVASNQYYSATPGSAYTRVVQVSGSLNNPFTATGSFANPAGFIILAQGFVSLKFNGSDVTYPGIQFHEAGAAHVIYNLPLTYAATSATGSVLVLY
jgi:hypothetical protein